MSWVVTVIDGLRVPGERTLVLTLGPYATEQEAEAERRRQHFARISDRDRWPLTYVSPLPGSPNATAPATKPGAPWSGTNSNAIKAACAAAGHEGGHHGP